MQGVFPLVDGCLHSDECWIHGSSSQMVPLNNPYRLLNLYRVVTCAPATHLVTHLEGQADYLSKSFASSSGLSGTLPKPAKRKLENINRRVA